MAQTKAKEKTPALVRTLVPMIVGALAAWLLETLGVTLPLDPATETVTVILSALYYGALTWAEEQWPWLSVFLGSKKRPEYHEPYVGKHRE